MVVCGSREAPVVAYGSADHAVERAAAAELRRLGRQGTVLGQMALVLARRIDLGSDPPSSLPRMASQLRVTMASATLGAVERLPDLDEHRRRARVARRPR